MKDKTEEQTSIERINGIWEEFGQKDQENKKI